MMLQEALQYWLSASMILLVGLWFVAMWTCRDHEAFLVRLFSRSYWTGDDE